MPDRRQGRAHLARGVRVERVLLTLHGPAGAHVRAKARHPLRYEPSHPDGLPGREQMVGRLGP
jgi:hypothetical protein